MKRYFAMFLFAALVISLGSCAKRWTTTNPMEKPLPQPLYCRIGAISDSLPAGFPEDKKPKAEDIEKLRSDLREQLNQGGWLNVPELQDTSSTDFVIVGAITYYQKGNAFLRAVPGLLPGFMGTGAAKLGCTLRLININTQEVVFGGKFAGAVYDFQVSGDATYDQAAIDFAKALDKQMSKLHN